MMIVANPIRIELINAIKSLFSKRYFTIVFILQVFNPFITEHKHVFNHYSVPAILQVVKPISVMKKVTKKNFKYLPTPSAQGGERYVTYSSCFSMPSLKAWRFLSRHFPAYA